MPLPLIMLMGAAGRAGEAPPGPFRFEVVTAGADTFQLPIYNGGTYDFHVDWGDSSSDDITAWNDAAANHSYAGADTYNVVITGTLIGWRFNNAGDKTLIHDISEWGVLDVGDLNSYFYGCSNLTISATDSMNCPNTTSFANCFRSCTSLTAIPSGLFDKCTLVENFTSCFYGCTSLTAIPSGLFDKCTLVENFTSCFYGCTSLTAIPSGLFDKCTLVTTFSALFNSIGITEIPSGLFDKCTLVTTFNQCFSGCTSLTSIPSGLFDKCTLVENFTSCFYGCTSLTAIPSGLFDSCTLVEDFLHTFHGSAIASIPSGLFDSCTLADQFDYCFTDCTSINTDLPANLILYNVAIVDVRSMFSGCASMTGDGTAFVDQAETHGVTSHTFCFTNCTSLPDYNLIPADWGGGA